jgi:hypothetical protein
MMGLGFVSVALAAVIAFVLALFLYMDFGNPLVGFFGGLITYFVLLKVLAGLP